MSKPNNCLLLHDFFHIEIELVNGDVKRTHRIELEKNEKMEGVSDPKSYKEMSHYIEKGAAM